MIATLEKARLVSKIAVNISSKDLLQDELVESLEFLRNYDLPYNKVASAMLTEATGSDSRLEPPPETSASSRSDSVSAPACSRMLSAA